MLNMMGTYHCPSETKLPPASSPLTTFPLFNYTTTSLSPDHHHPRPHRLTVEDYYTCGYNPELLTTWLADPQAKQEIGKVSTWVKTTNNSTI